MKRVKKKLTKMLNAITFAEAGEHETALSYMNDANLTPQQELSTASSTEHIDSSGVINRTENHFSAAAFAEAGEFDSALELVGVPKRPKAVLLIFDGDNDESDALDYAVSLCRRMRATLEVLALTDGTVPVDFTKDSRYKKVKAQCAKRHNLACVISELSATTDKDLLEYMRTHKEIAAVIYSSDGARKKINHKSLGARTLERIMEKFSIPLVNVLSKRPSGAH